MATAPTAADARRMILDELGTMHMRAGYALPVSALHSRLVGGLRLTGEEFMAGCDLMIAQDEIEQRDNKDFLSAAGFAAI